MLQLRRKWLLESVLSLVRAARLHRSLRQHARLVVRGVIVVHHRRLYSLHILLAHALEPLQQALHRIYVLLLRNVSTTVGRVRRTASSPCCQT